MIDRKSKNPPGNRAVFDRLYSKQTAASSAHHSKKEEDNAKRKKEEEEELAKCTFKPTTKWDLASERRRKAKEQVERAAYEKKGSPTKQSNRPIIRRRQSKKEELNECTFKPRTKWDLVAERRQLARKQREREEYEAKRLPKRGGKLSDRETRDRKLEEEELKYCTFKPKLMWNKKEERDDDQESDAETEAIPRKGDLDRSAPRTIRMDGQIMVAAKPKFTEETIESRTEKSAPRGDSRPAIKESVPDWKRKYDSERKQHEVVITAQGRASIIKSQTPVKAPIRGTETQPTHAETEAEKEEPLEKEVDDVKKAENADIGGFRVAQKADSSAPQESGSTVSNMGGFRIASAPQESKAEVSNVGGFRVAPKANSAPQESEATVSDVGGFRVVQKADVASSPVDNDTKPGKKASKWKDRIRNKRSKSESQPEKIAADEKNRLEREEAERVAKEEEEKLAHEEAELLAKEEEDRLAREEAKILAKEEERLAHEEAERVSKEEQERLAREEAILLAERLAREEAELLAKEEEERPAREESELLAKEEEERLAREESELLAKEEEERLAREEAELLAKEEQERLAGEEAERLAKEEEERLAHEEADRVAKEEQQRLADEEAERVAAVALKADEPEKRELKGKSERAKKWKERLEKKSKAKALKTEEVVAEKKPSDAEHRQQMIDDEFKGIMKETEDNELDEPFEPEAVEALRIAANKLAYLKKYYNSFTDEFVYFPSVTKLLVNYSMIEEAEKHYFDEEDEFPMDYSAALRSVACEKIGDEDDDENDDDYMMRVAADVDLGEPAKEAAGEKVESVAQEEEGIAQEEIEKSTPKAEEVVAEKKPSDAEHRQQMIDDEFKGIMKETEDNELDEPFEPEAVEALRIAANKLAYLKKYYNSFTDEFVYFPSVTKLLVNYSMIEEAEKHYFDEEDEFPIDYSAALRSVACEKVGDDDDDENDDDYMMRVAADVDLS